MCRPIRTPDATNDKWDDAAKQWWWLANIKTAAVARILPLLVLCQCQTIQASVSVFANSYCDDGSIFNKLFISCSDFGVVIFCCNFRCDRPQPTTELTWALSQFKSLIYEFFTWSVSHSLIIAFKKKLERKINELEEKNSGFEAKLKQLEDEIRQLAMETQITAHQHRTCHDIRVADPSLISGIYCHL